MSRIVVVGGGIVGLWTAAEAARNGYDVTLYERFHIGHNRGSSHGDTRIFRSAYWEGSEYVTLARISAQMWDWLSGVAGKPLLNMCGTYYAGASDCALISGVRTAAQKHKIDLIRHETSLELNTTADIVELEEATGGIIRADESLAALTAYCKSKGVTILENTVFTSRRSSEDTIIRCAGPWFAKDHLLSRYLKSCRVYCHWFEHNSSLSCFEKAFLIQGQDGRVLYGTRIGPQQIKVGWHNYPILPMEAGHSENESPQQYTNDIQNALIATTHSRFNHLRSKGCYFTNSTDENYIVDWLGPKELVVAGLSGHGFKFAPALGAGVIEAVQSRKIPNYLSSFALSRFKNKPGTGRTHLADGDIYFGKSWKI